MNEEELKKLLKDKTENLINELKKEKFNLESLIKNEIKN